MPNWISIGYAPPPKRKSVKVKDTPAGPEYIARWNGPGYGWTVLTFPINMVPAAQPQFWLSQ